MKILGIDLGKFNSAACLLDTASDEYLYFSLKSTASEFRLLLSQAQPEQVVIEACANTGWVYDLCQSAGFDVIVANPNHEAWHWKHVKRKTDKDDALKLAKLAAVGQIDPVYVPSAESRQYRQIVKYRKRLVSRVTQCQNTIRAIFNLQGISIPTGHRAWSISGLEILNKYSDRLSACEPNTIWKGQLHIELNHLDCLWEKLQLIDDKLTDIAKQDSRVQILESIPGVGRKTAEVVVAYIDDPNRFKNARQVSAYAGLVPRQHQTGQTNRMGRITHRGPGILRSALVEASWAMLQYNPWAKAIYERIHGGQKTRKKQAIIAVARKLFVLCWTLLRKNEYWDPEKLCTAE